MRKDGVWREEERDEKKRKESKRKKENVPVGDGLGKARVTVAREQFNLVRHVAHVDQRREGGGGEGGKNKILGCCWASQSF